MLSLDDWDYTLFIDVFQERSKGEGYPIYRDIFQMQFIDLLGKSNR